MAKAYIERDGFKHKPDCTFAIMSDEEWEAAGHPYCHCGPTPPSDHTPIFDHVIIGGSGGNDKATSGG